MRKFFKVFFITFLCVLLLVVLFVGSLVTTIAIQGYSQEKACFEEQIQRLSELETAYASDGMAKIDESSFCNFDLAEVNSIKYNRLRELGSHNSYKKQYSSSAQFATKLFFPLAGQDPNQSDYFHESFTDQLNSGLRSFELDIAKQKDKKGEKLVVQHAPLMDGNSWSINLALGLKEVALWSQYNPSHMPITILLEIKKDFLLKPGISKMSNEDLTLLESIVTENLGASLFSPSDMLGDYTTFKGLRQANGFPTLDKMQGKVLILLHPGILTEAQLEKNYADTKIFAVSDDVDITDNDPKSDDNDALFLLDNDPFQSERIAINVNKKFIVRTRIDYYGNYDKDRYAAAIASNAQILSSDYLPRVNPIEGQYVCLLPNNKTMSLVPQ